MEQFTSVFFDAISFADFTKRMKMSEEVYTSPQGVCRVLKATQDGRIFAVKCLKPNLIDDPTANSLLQKEAHIVTHLTHPFIVHALDFQKIDNYGWCIIFDWVEGTTLDKFLNEHTLKADEAKRIASELCQALQYLQHHQIVHRDIKPENIIISSTGNHVCLTDFGLSDAGNVTAFKQAAGTPSYTAPEVIEGKINNTQSDIYSLGRILEQLHPSLRRIALQCCNSLPERRPSIDEILTQVERVKRKDYKLLTAIIVAAVAAAVAIYVTRPSKQQTPQLPTPPSEIKVSIDTNRVDTQPVLQPIQQPAPSVTPIEQPTATKLDANAIKRNALKAVERQATTLFNHYKDIVYNEDADPSERARASQQFSDELNKIAIREAARYADNPDIDSRELESQAINLARDVVKKLVANKSNQ